MCHMALVVVWHASRASGEPRRSVSPTIAGPPKNVPRKPRDLVHFATDLLGRVRLTSSDRVPVHESDGRVHERMLDPATDLDYEENEGGIYSPPIARRVGIHH